MDWETVDYEGSKNFITIAYSQLYHHFHGNLSFK